MTRILLILALLATALPAQLITYVSDAKGKSLTNGGTGAAGKGLIRIHVPTPLPADTTVRLMMSIDGGDEVALDLFGPRKNAAVYHSRPGEVTIRLIYETPKKLVIRTFKFTAKQP